MLLYARGVSMQINKTIIIIIISCILNLKIFYKYLNIIFL